MKYTLVGVYVDKEYEDYVRRLEYSWSGYNRVFSLQYRENKSALKITALLAIDLEYFSLVKLKIEDCIEMIDELGIGDVVTKECNGFFYSYWHNLYPMLSEDSNSVILPDSVYEKGSEGINNFCNIKISIPAIYTSGRKSCWHIMLLVNLWKEKIGIGYGSFILNEIQGSIKKSALSHCSYSKRIPNLEMRNYLELQDFGSHFVFFNNAVIYRSIDENIIINNKVENIVYEHYHEKLHLNIVVPTSVKKICIAYDRDVKKCSTTFMFSKKLEDIEFEFCESINIYEAFYSLKKAPTDVIENEFKINSIAEATNNLLNNFNISIEFY